MADLLNKALSSMTGVKKPQKAFILLLLTTLKLFQGKATFRNLSRYCHSSEKRFSRWYRRVFDFTMLNINLLFQTLPKAQQYIAAIDASFMKKSGKETEGLAKFYNGCHGKAEKGLEISLISIIDMRSNTAYGIDAKQTIDNEKQSRIELYAAQVVKLAHTLLKFGVKYLAADAYYGKDNFIKPVMATGLNIIGKLRVDANLKWFYQGKYSGLGRRKKYDGKVLFEPELSKFTYEGQQGDKTQIYSATVYSCRFQIPLKLVMLLRVENGKLGRSLLFSTDVNLDAQSIIQFYRARFQIEFLFRDAKQFTGLIDCQSTNKKAIHTHINASLTALNLLKLEDAIEKNNFGRTVISIASWKRRKFNKHLAKLIFNKLDLNLSNKKITQVYDEISHYGVIAA